MNALSNEELKRYARHLSLPRFGRESQKKLKEARVLVVGAGGLGAPLLQYLTAAGVGHMGIVDFDRIDLSNLQRQVLFGTSEVGKLKTETAIRKLQDQNPHVNFRIYNERLTSANALEIIGDYDIVADGTDNFPTRYLVNDACVLLNKVNVYASIYQFEGQISVFNAEDEVGVRGPNYRDLFPEPPPPGMVPSCAEGGVLGVLPGIVGSLQALEVIKVITGIGHPLTGVLCLVDTLDFSFRKVNIPRDPRNPLTGNNPTQKGLIDYEDFCGVTLDLEDEVNPLELKEWMKDQEIYLVDVREAYERAAADIGGLHIPMDKLLEKKDLIPKGKKVVVYCKSGGRSRKAIEYWRQSGVKSDFYNLTGGILAWRDQLDPDLVIL